MTWKLFSELTEIKTAPLDLMWVVYAAAFSYYQFGDFNWIYVLPCMVLVIFFHLIVNMQNNYMDYKNSSTKGDYRTKTSTIGTSGIALSVVKKWLIGLSILPMVGGLILAYYTGWPTLVIGLIATVFGLGYSGGPKPLNSTILCEFSVAFPIAICIPTTYVYLGTLGVHNFDGKLLLLIVLASLPNFFAFFATQLANNICDVDQDVLNGRKTMVSYIGVSKALKVYWGLMTASFVAVIVAVIFGAAAWIDLLTLAFFYVVYQNTKIINTNQNKKEIYGVIVKMNSSISVIFILLLSIAAVIKNLI